jgi:hypothetical protein
MLKYKYIIILLLYVIQSNIYSQKLSVGINAGANFSFFSLKTPNGQESSSNIFCNQNGIHIVYKLSNKIALNLSPNIENSRADFYTNNITFGQTTILNNKINYTYLDVPFCAQYNVFNNKFFIELGLTNMILLNSSSKLKVISSTTVFYNENEVNNNNYTNSYLIGGIIGAGYNILESNKIKIGLDINYRIIFNNYARDYSLDKDIQIYSKSLRGNVFIIYKI